MRRKNLSKKKSRKNFNKGHGINKKNNISPMRGGFRF